MATAPTPQPHRHQALRRPQQTGQFEDIQTYKRAHGQDIKRGQRGRAGGKKEEEATKRG